MTFSLTIDMDNAAFEDLHPHLAVSDLLHALANRMSFDARTGETGNGKAIMDDNGNRVGEWIIAEHPPVRAKRSAR